MLNQLETHLQKVTNIGNIELRPFNLEIDLSILFSWTSQPYARFWGHLESNIAELRADYSELIGSGHTRCYLGYINDDAAFFLELYDPNFDDIAKHYDVLKGDIGLHILISPTDQPIQGFTYEIFSQCMAFLFQHPFINRVVVEPDIGNAKIHKINRRAGFKHERIVDLGHKQAYLGFCDRESFNNAQLVEKLPLNKMASELKPSDAVINLDIATWRRANQQQISKTISELAHERIIDPQHYGSHQGRSYYLITADNEDIEYRFSAIEMSLNHWLVEEDHIEKYISGEPAPLDAIQFIVEFQTSMGIHDEMLPTYLEEISSTLSGRAYKLKQKNIAVSELVKENFQTIETAMNEGHPSFIANNGRIGFDAQDFHRYAPESANPVKLIWVAAKKENVDFACINDLDYQTLLENEFDLATLEQYRLQLKSRQANLDDYYLIPVHPWQWFNKLAHVYASDIAKGDIICLGYSDDAYQAQQSIRTFFNVSHPQKHYVKTALSIVNMGFVRGLSSYYMRTTPAINEWLFSQLKNDQFIQTTGFTILRELAAVGYRNPHFEQANVKNSPYKKMLAGLWRESPVTLIKQDQQLRTMASLLHVDHNGDSLLLEMINASGLSIKEWLEQYLNAYLKPILHCYYAHEIVFMPHGENIILVMEDHVPIRTFMKDIGEEACLLNSDKKVPESVDRIHVSLPKDMELLSVYTDIFDGFFRYMSAILLDHAGFTERAFWQTVATCISQYQDSQPQLSERFAEHDIFQDVFAHSCLNRLQLRNNQQMVDLSDPANSLAFAGTLSNPIAEFAPRNAMTEGDVSCNG